MQGRNWLATLNNPTDVPHEFLERMFNALKATYVCGQLEKGEEGTAHIQYFINLPKPTRISALKKMCSKSHFELVKVNNGADDYCLKEDTRVEGPWEFGKKPHKRNSKTDWERVYEEAKVGNLDAIPASVKVQHYGNLQKIAKDNLVVQDSPDLRGIWIYGPAGIGKSRKAREDYPDFYPKLANKWWDGYKGQKHVILDDFGLDHKCLAQQLKLWGDRYGVILETKGGAVASKFDKFVITSQYSIEQIFGEDQATVEALKRRFKVIHMVNLQ